MSLSIYAEAFIPATNKTYLKHKKVLEACIEAGVTELPKETAEYFGDKNPSEYLLEEKLVREIVTHDILSESVEGIEVYVKDIPPGTEKIRFGLSY